MKRTLCALLLAVVLFPACQQKTVVAPVDPEAIKGQVTALMDNYISALNEKNVDQIVSYLSEDLLFLGTDPSEFWTREAIADMWEQVFADTTFSMKYAVDKREIKVATDGNSAIVVDQFIVAWVSPKIPVRFVYHLVKAESGWMIDFASAAMIPKNEELPALNKALE